MVEFEQAADDGRTMMTMTMKMTLQTMMLLTMMILITTILIFLFQSDLNTYSTVTIIAVIHNENRTITIINMFLFW